MKADWARTIDSASDQDLRVLRASSSPPPGSGIYYLRMAAEQFSLSGNRHAGFRNTTVGDMTGQHEVEGILRLGAGSVDAVVGIATIWKQDSLEDPDAYILELVGGTTTPELRLYRGFDSDTALVSATSLAYGSWVHVLLQVRYDRTGNQQIWVATNDLSLHLASAPVWLKWADPILVPKHQAKVVGKTGFHMQGGAVGTVVSLDQFAVRSTLSAVT